ncbi:MAG: peptide/nickel transport system permease protein [Solirubrobacteraceae bacterium]|jgi:peptide/nickel transport system permease protein|nr:peptide/nickel transport system permease protein [Solirubrobacteraceae bacterium]
MSAQVTAESTGVVLPPRRRSQLSRLERTLGGRGGLVGAGILLVLVLVAVLAPLLAPHSPEQIDAARVLAAPDLSHPFGSDALGRDVLSRVLYAFRTSLAISIGSVALAMLAGVPLGLIAGYRGGWVDAVLMRPLDMLLALPALLLAVSLVSILGPGSFVVLVAIAVIYLPILARVLRSSVLVVRERPYVLGARARGVGPLGIMVRHVLPNAVGPVLVQATVLMGFALQVEAALSFLGLGAQPPTPSLGLMLLDGYQVLQQAWWVDVFPGLAIALTVVAFLLIGDGLRRRYDPAGVAE